MDAERLKQIEDIYHAALEKPASGREAFLDGACAEDRELRREVETLLVFENSADNFLDAPLESPATERLSERDEKSDLVNKKIGRYRIVRLLGKGGMGEVYLAEDTRLNRRVALKFLSDAISGDETRRHRFEREALSASALNHPNILTIYEFGEDDGAHFIASEYVEGETLRDVMHDGELSLKKILSIAEQTAIALAAAHKAGIIHRDIKPENIMVRSEDGIVKVLDFGLAKLSAAEKSSVEAHSESATRMIVKTSPGMVMGTVAYMSPEQTRGLANIDARTDIWSLGVMLFEMLTGNTPFEGETASDVIAAILKSEPPPVSQRAANCPPEIDRIVEKALQKDREERYQVIKDLALDLKSLRKELEFSAQHERVSNSGAKTATSETPQQHSTVAGKARPGFAPRVLLILLAATVAAGSAWWFFGRPDRAPTVDTASLKTTEIVNWSSSPGEIYSVGAFSPDAKMVAFASTKSGTSNIWVKQTAAGEAVQVTKDEFENKQPVWSPNGEEIAYYSKRGNRASIWRIPQLGGAPKFVAPVYDGSVRLRFWSKNNVIFYESRNEIFATDADSGESKQITDFKSKNIKGASLSLSSDEKMVVYATVEDKTWALWTADLTGDAPRKLFSSPHQIRNAVWHPDAQRVFFSAPVDGIFQIFVTDIAGSPPKQVTFAERNSLVLEVSADGTKILYGSAKEESDVWGVNLTENKEFSVASDIDSELWADASPDGKTVVYQSIRNLSQGDKLFSGNLMTKELPSAKQAVELVSNGFLPKWSPDGKTVAFMRLTGNQYQIEIIKPASSEQKPVTKEGVTPINNSVLPYNRLQVSDFGWSPDSRKIAYVADRNDQRNIWTIDADGSNDVQLTANESNLIYNCPLWSADGRRITFASATNNAEGKPTYGIWVIDVETKKADPIWSGNTFTKLIGWSNSPDELILASIEKGQGVMHDEVSLRRLEINKKTMGEIVKLKETYLHNIHLSPDKKTIAFAAHRDGKDNVWTMPAAGGEAVRVTGNNDSRLYFSSLAWSPDNSMIFFGKQSRYSLLSMLTNFR